MAGGAPFSSSARMTVFLFSLLLAFHFAMAVPERTFFSPPSTSTKDGTKKRNTMVDPSAREGTTQNTKMNMTPKEANKGINVPDVLLGPKGGPSRASRPPLQWQDRIFNASEHEVPSGPNPISNR